MVRQPSRRAIHDRRAVADAMSEGDGVVLRSDCPLCSSPLQTHSGEVLRGFHVLRHSFGSNLARSGKVPRDTIAKWMGHSTEEMKDLYQHHFPQDGQSQIEALK